MTATIFANGAVLDGTQADRREGHYVSRTTASRKSPTGRFAALPPIQSISPDLAGRMLMPGLIDAHVHAIAVDAALARLAEQPITLVSLQAARVLDGVLARGFTTVRDAGGADGDPLRDISRLDGQGEHLSVIMKGGVLHKRMD